jgi:hypothetical protein
MAVLHKVQIAKHGIEGEVWLLERHGRHWKECVQRLRDKREQRRGMGVCPCAGDTRLDSLGFLLG